MQKKIGLTSSPHYFVEYFLVHFGRPVKKRERNETRTSQNSVLLYKTNQESGTDKQFRKRDSFRETKEQLSTCLFQKRCWGIQKDG